VTQPDGETGRATGSSAAGGDGPAATREAGVRAGAALRLALLFAAHAIGTATIMAVLAFAPAIQATLSLAPSTFGLLAAAFYAMQPLAALPAGWLTDRIGVRAALVASMLLLAASVLLLAAAGGVVSAGLGLALGGTAYALLNPATGKGVITWFTPHWRSTVMSAKQSGVPAGGMLAATLAALGDATDWRAALAMIAAAAVAAALAALLVLDRDPAPAGAEAGADPTPRRGLAGVFANRALLRVCSATAVLTAGQAAFFAYLVLFLAGPVGLTPAAAAALFGATHVVSAAARIAWGVLADRGWRSQPRRCLRFIAALSAAGFVLLAAGERAGVGVAGAAALALGATVAGFAGVAQSAAVTGVARAEVGAAMGLFMVLAPGGAVVGPALFGAVLSLGLGYAPAHLVMGALAAFAALVLLAAPRPASPARAA